MPDRVVLLTFFEVDLKRRKRSERKMELEKKLQLPVLITSVASKIGETSSKFTLSDKNWFVKQLNFCYMRKKGGL